MFSSVVLTLFAVLLLLACVASFRWPALAVALGISVFGLEQIVAARYEILQAQPAAFNIAIALIIGGAFAAALVTRRAQLCQTKPGRWLLALVYGYVALFWLSSAWSPFTNGSDNLGRLPYFLVHVLVLPFLVQLPHKMLAAFAALWVILFAGLSGLIASPSFETTIALGRAAVYAGGQTDTEAANPLALADTAILLAVCSGGMLLAGPLLRRRSRGVRILVWVAGLAGLGLGLWIAFLASRGESLAGMLALAALFTFAKSRGAWRAVLLQCLAAGALGAVLIAAYAFYSDAIAEKSPRFEEKAMLEGLEVREHLAGRVLSASFASWPTALFGVGARASEELYGTYPHSALVQALAETGLLGLLLHAGCCALVCWFGVATLYEAKRRGNYGAALCAAFVLTLLLYHLVILNKKSSLAAHDLHMWLALSAVVFDRVSTSLTANPIRSRGRSRQLCTAKTPAHATTSP